MSSKKTIQLDQYESGKQLIALIINLFVLVGSLVKLFKFSKYYIQLEIEIHIISTILFVISLILLLINRKRFYKLCYLIVSFVLLFTLIINDFYFHESYTRLNLLRSEVFTRNLLILLPQVALIGFMLGKKQMLSMEFILISYATYNIIVNHDNFIQDNIAIYFLLLLGFCLASYFLVDANEKFIKELQRVDKKLKETQQQLIQSEKMASLGTLTAGVSHEINNPLNFINGGIYVISSMEDEMNIYLPRELKKKLKLSLKMISEGFDRIHTIVQSLNSISHRGTSFMTNIQIHEIIDKTLLFMKIKISQKIEIKKLYDLSTPLQVDPSKIHLVLYNILDNAIQAVDYKSQKEKWIEIVTKEEKNIAYIIISNNGPKIPENLISKIFDPFFTTKDPGKGTGLGLSISYALISEHNGNIYAKNTKEGVSFIIEIPITLASDSKKLNKVVCSL